jgi:hypothetical protein
MMENAAVVDGEKTGWQAMMKTLKQDEELQVISKMIIFRPSWVGVKSAIDKLFLIYYHITRNER